MSVTFVDAAETVRRLFLQFFHLESQTTSDEIRDTSDE
jgi:hypothetical protein